MKRSLNDETTVAYFFFFPGNKSFYFSSIPWEDKTPSSRFNEIVCDFPNAMWHVFNLHAKSEGKTFLGKVTTIEQKAPVTRSVEKRFWKRSAMRLEGRERKEGGNGRLEWQTTEVRSCETPDLMEWSCFQPTLPLPYLNKGWFRSQASYSLRVQVHLSLRRFSSYQLRLFFLFISCLPLPTYAVTWAAVSLLHKNSSWSVWFFWLQPFMLGPQISRLSFEIWAIDIIV